MKVLQINIFGNLSTGRIAADIYRTLIASGGEGKIAYARNAISQDIQGIKIGTDFDVKVHALMTRITDKTGFYSKGATQKLLKEIDEYRPDIIHLHNIHGYYLHIGILFEYLKKNNVPIVWTLHDCWAFTGHCCHYSIQKCKRWETGCYKCPQKKAYPASKFMDNSKWNYYIKEELFTGVNMTLVTVSEWLAKEVRRSFLKDYPLKVIYNGIDLDMFKPMKSEFRKKYKLENKKIILGVASTWGKRKGLDDFIRLADMLDEHYVIVLVGVNKREKSRLHKNMIGISRTDSIQELCEIYSEADIFFNASVEETFGLPTVEALACGTPVIVYDATALPEAVDSSCGYIVKANDIDKVKQIIISGDYLDISSAACVNRARLYDKKIQFKNYVNLYESVITEVTNYKQSSTF